MVFTLTNTIGKYAKNPPGGGEIVNWVAVGQGGNIINTSANGTLWKGQTQNGGVTSGNGVAYGNNLWVAVGSGTNTIATSPDGITWTGRASTFGYGFGVAFKPPI